MDANLFYLMNASAHPPHLTVFIATLISKQLLYALLGLAIVGMIVGSARTRYLIVVAGVAGVVAALLSWLIGHVMYTPRPFVLDMGHKLISHKDNGSFPSNHMMLMTIMTTTLLLGRHMRLFWGMLVLSLLMGWSRIYLGVHFPSDIAGGLIIGALVTYGVWKGMQHLPYMPAWLSRT